MNLLKISQFPGFIQCFPDISQRFPDLFTTFPRKFTLSKFFKVRKWERCGSVNPHLNIKHKDYSGISGILIYAFSMHNPKWRSNGNREEEYFRESNKIIRNNPKGFWSGNKLVGVHFQCMIKKMCLINGKIYFLPS